MMSLLKQIYPLCLAPNSPDTDRAVELLCKELPFKVHQYPAGEECNGWTVPHSWFVKKAEIRKDGQLIYDGKAHPLGVMGYAKPFKGKVSLEKLQKHLTYREDWPDAIGYHCDYFYKPWRADWGFSLPYNLFRKLKKGNYDIDLQTAYENKPMKVCDYFLKGKTSKTVIFNAHNCHAAQANDDIAGLVVGVELMKRLARRKNRLSYRFIAAPEHLGTVFYLKHCTAKTVQRFHCGFFLEMLGNRNRLAFQETFTGTHELDRAAHHYLKFRHPDHFSDKFRKVIGNDETVWEAAGYEVPTASLSRWPYKEYHTSRDNADIIDGEMLEESVQAVLGIVDILETNATVVKKFKGLVALSHPKYDLYVAPGTDPSIKMDKTEDRKKWNYMMDCLPRYFDGKMRILDMAAKHDIEYSRLYDYLLKFKAKGLVDFRY